LIKKQISAADVEQNLIGRTKMKYYKHDYRDVDDGIECLAVIHRLIIETEDMSLDEFAEMVDALDDDIVEEVSKQDYREFIVLAKDQWGDDYLESYDEEYIHIYSSCDYCKYCRDIAFEGKPEMDPKGPFCFINHDITKPVFDCQDFDR
jgi:hypothetical protein